MTGVGVTVGVAVLEGVAGTGVKVARRVAVGRAVVVAVAVSVESAAAAGVGTGIRRPQPLSSKASHSRTPIRRIIRIPRLRPREQNFAKPLLSLAARIVTKEGPKVKRWPSGLTGVISDVIIRRYSREDKDDE